MVPPLPSNKAAWQWAEITKPGDVTLNHVLTAYRMNLNFCNGCRKNVKGNPCCLSGLGEKIWLGDASPADDSDLLREKNSYVGLKNLGATCYANAFLQVWFHMPEIRNAVFSWNSLGVEDDACSSICQIISCLQEVFGLLYFSRRRFIDPTTLLNCLLLDNTVQQDAQEFSKLFMSKLDELASHGRSIFHNFVGKYDYVTSCTKCGNKTRSRSEFYELDLNIVNNRKLSSCLEEFLKKETLDGDNQFFCSACRMKQDASRCIELVELPDTLNLQLLRFVYDKEKQSKKKISTPLTFPETLDMSPYVKQNPSSKKGGASPDESLVYDLFAILIHNGQLASSGHYIAVIRDYKTGSTFQFNDEKVVKLDGELSGYDLDNDVGEGCSTPEKDNSNNNKIRKPKLNREMSLVNAYMLVYRRRNAAVNINDDIAFEDLPNSLKEKISKHDKELDDDILNESIKLELINQKQENIRLLYSTLLSYEGCGAEVKSAMFEFVPAQTLKKFFQFGDSNDNNKTKAKETDNDMETNIENDDNDNDISAVNYNYDKEYERFFCKHRRLNPDEVMQLKILPSGIVDIIYDQLGLTRRLPCSDVLCRDCVVKRCSDINAKMALNEDLKKINNIMKSKQYEPIGYLVGKESWKNWKKKAERNLLLECGDVMETDQTMMDIKDDPIPSEMFNSDLLCCHDQLDPNEQNWKYVSYEVWEVVRKYFPSCPEYTYGSPCCAICEDKSQQEQMVQDESKQQAILLRQLLNDLYLNRKRPSLTTLRKYQSHLNNCRRSKVNDSATFVDASKSDHEMSSAIVISDDDQQKPDQPDFGFYGYGYDDDEEIEHVPKDRLKYFLVSSTFIEGWKKCCKDATKQKMPHSVCNGLLLCYHGKLLFDPWDSTQSVEISRQFVLLWPEEWDILKSYVDVIDQEIFVEVAEGKSTGTSFAISMPELCVECLEERRIEELNSKYHYNKARIYVYRLDEQDSDSHTNPTNQTSAASHNNNKADDKSKKRKSDEEAVQLPEKYPRLESSATIRRSGRRSKNRGEKEIMVSSSMTLRQLNFELFHHFRVFKTNQVLYMDGRELVGDDLTLEKLCVPPEAVIRLEVREDMDEHFVTNTVGGSVEEGFKGTGLVG